MTFNRITRRDVFFILVALVVGFGIGFYGNKNEIKANKDITSRIINNCTESLIATNELINSCSSAYTTFGTCVLNIQSCNIQEESKKLETLNKQKQQAEEKIRSLTKDMDAIILDLSKKD